MSYYNFVNLILVYQVQQVLTTAQDSVTRAVGGGWIVVHKTDDLAIETGLFLQYLGQAAPDLIGTYD
jgi:hypothetical protein